MIISSRLHKIINECLNRRLTIDELAKELNVSRRTIFREINDLENILEEYNLKLITRGIVRIIGNDEDIDRFTATINNIKEHYIIDRDERQILITYQVLQSKKVEKIIVYANRFNVSEATISNDLIKIEKLLNSYNIIVNKTNNDVHINGHEKDIRTLMASLLPNKIKDENYNASNLHHKLFSNKNNGIMNLINKDIAEKIIKVFEKNHDKFKLNRFVESSYVGLIIHLTLAIERILSNEIINNYEKVEEEYENDDNYRIAKLIAEKLEEEFLISIPKFEIIYITMHLQGSKLNNADSRNISKDSLIVEIADYMINNFDTKLNIKKDQYLSNGLIAHLKPAMVRINNKLDIYNPLLDDIKDKYQEIYLMSEVVCDKISKNYNIKFNEHEIGFITMHFGAAIERALEENKTKRIINIGVICASGIGISSLLCAKIDKITNNNVRVKPYSLIELKNNKIEVDLIVSTFELEKIEYLKVNHLLEDDDINKILNKILEYENTIVDSVIENKEIEFDEIYQLINIQKNIIDQFKLAHKKIDEFKDIIDYIEQNIIKDKNLDIIDKINIRESKDSMIYSNLKFGVIHLADVIFEEPIVKLVQLKNDSLIKVNFIIFMFANTHENYQVQKLMSYISSAIIEDDKVFNCFSYDDETKIVEMLKIKFIEMIKKI